MPSNTPRRLTAAATQMEPSGPGIVWSVYVCV